MTTKHSQSGAQAMFLRMAILLGLLCACLSPVCAMADVSLNFDMTAPTSVAVFQNFSYHFAITNTGTTAGNDKNFYVQDVLPAGTTFISARLVDGSDGGIFGCGPVGQTVTCSTLYYYTLPLGAVANFEITVATNISAACAPLVNTASLDDSADGIFGLVSPTATTTLTGCDTSYAVTPSASANGTISPDTVQAVLTGHTTSFTVTPNAGYAATMNGTCGGVLSGGTYTTLPVVGDCTVFANFAPDNYTVTPSADLHGTISPNVPIAANSKSVLEFTVIPDLGYFAAMGGSCGGTYPAGTNGGTFTYTVSQLTADCTVLANFAPRLVLTSSANPSVRGQSVIFTATLSAPNLTGSVTFTGTVPLNYFEKPFCENVPVVGNTATCAPSPDLFLDGPSLIIAMYDTGIYDSLTQTTYAATTSLSIAPLGSIALGSSLMVAASLQVLAPGVGEPTGTITISDTTDNLTCSYLLGASSGCLISPTSAGQKII